MNTFKLKPIITRASGLPIEDNKMPFNIELKDGMSTQKRLHRVYMTDECATLLQQYIDSAGSWPEDEEHTDAPFGGYK